MIEKTAISLGLTPDQQGMGLVNARGAVDEAAINAHDQAIAALSLSTPISMETKFSYLKGVQKTSIQNQHNMLGVLFGN